MEKSESIARDLKEPNIGPNASMKDSEISQSVK